MNSPAPTRTHVSRLRVLLPLELRVELTRRALEERRSPEAQAEHILAQVLQRSLARRQEQVHGAA